MRPTPHAAVLVLALIAPLSAAGTAEARPIRGPGKSVLLLRLEAKDLPAALSAKLDLVAREQIKASLRGVHLLPPPALDFDSMRVAAGCVDEGPDCLANLGGTLGAGRVIRIQIDKAAAKTSQVTLTSVVLRDRRHPQTTRFEIEDLDDGAAEEFRYQIAVAMGDQRRPAPRGAIVLAGPSEIGALEGVEIFLDDRKVAQQGLAKLPPGDHRLQLHKEGYASIARNVVVRPGRDTVVPVDFDHPTVDAVAVPLQVPGGAAVADAPRLMPTGESSSLAESPSALRLDASPPGTGPHLFYSWFLGGGALAALAVGIGFAVDIHSVLSTIDQKCGMRDKDNRCTGPQRVDCDAPTGAAVSLCSRGHRDEIATWIAFPVAGVLSGLAAYAFIKEEGLTLFGGGGSGPEADAPAVSGVITPLPGGGTAALLGRF